MSLFSDAAEGDLDARSVIRRRAARSRARIVARWGKAEFDRWKAARGRP